MQVREIMTENPACCSPDAVLQDAARLMVENDCGEIPIVDDHNKPVGVVTDRDMACRGIAQGKGPDTSIREIMSESPVTVTQDTDLQECCDKMEENLIRRMPVVDDNGAVCGIVAQADIARQAPKGETAEVVKEISKSA